MPACRPRASRRARTRALDYGEFEDLKKRHGSESRVFPMPDPSISGPAVVIKPHRHTALVQSREPEVSNWEEL